MALIKEMSRSVSGGKKAFNKSIVSQSSLLTSQMRTTAAENKQ